MVKDLFVLFYCLQFSFNLLSVIAFVKEASYKGTDFHSNNTTDPNTDDNPDDVEILDKSPPKPYYENENATFGKQVVSDEYFLWPNATVHYEIAPEFAPYDRELIQAAMDGIQHETCVQFVEWQGQEDQHRVYFQVGTGCWSESVGYLRQPRQYVELGPYCSPGAKIGGIQHELLHVLGMTHTQQRPDRDKYIDIFWDNVEPDSGSRSQIEFWKWHSIRTYEAIPYDYSSVMHYPNNGMAIDLSKPTMSYKGNDEVCLGQGIGVTECDLELVRRLYKCIVMDSCKPELNYKRRSFPTFWAKTCDYLWY